METILDGTGKGYTVKVDPHNRLHVDSISTERESDASFAGYAYNINTGLITLTNASTKNAVLYLVNNEDYNLVIPNVRFMTGTSTGGSGNIIVDILRNPTTGTIVSGATPVEINQNRNFGSSKVLAVTAYKGATSSTFTNGNEIAKTILGTVTQRIEITTGTLVIPKGASIGINITTPAGNTSIAVAFALSCYLETEVGQN